MVKTDHNYSFITSIFQCAHAPASSYYVFEAIFYGFHCIKMLIKYFVDSSHNLPFTGKK